MSTGAGDSEYSRRVLICLLGLSPQILTETLYALAVRTDPPWVPTEIHVITTSSGARDAIAQLLSNESGKFHQFMRDYLPERQILFNGTSRFMHVIERDGVPLDDIDDPEDSTAAGNAILRVIAPLVGDQDCQIHASIAGGRKTMSALLLSTISLLGRPQDRVSHVLVPTQLERNRAFFYPPLRSVADSVAADDDVRLALVPVLRFAAGLRGRILDSGASYEDLVARAEHDLLPQPVVLALATCTVHAGAVSVTLEPMEMAWYAYLGERRRLGLQEDGLVAPGMVRIDKDPERNIGIDQSAIRRMFGRFVDIQFKPPASDADAFKTEFASRVSYINRQLRKGLGEATAQRLIIVGPGERKKRDGQYGLLNLEPNLIRLH